jgi:uncharacterized protein YjbJ (UPF0337 family)
MLFAREFRGIAISPIPGDGPQRRSKMTTSSTAPTSGTHDQVEGKVHEVKGAVKQKIGQVTNNPRLEDEGTAERIDGVIEKKVGDVKKVFNK